MHLHMLVYNLNAPEYGEDTNKDIATYYGEMHCHTRKGCQIGNTKRMPLWISSSTNVKNYSY